MQFKRKCSNTTNANAFRACIQSIRCQLWCIFLPAQLHWLPNASQINHKMFIEPRYACILAPSMHHIALSAATFQQHVRKLACGRLALAERMKMHTVFSLAQPSRPMKRTHVKRFHFSDFKWHYSDFIYYRGIVPITIHSTLSTCQECEQNARLLTRLFCWAVAEIILRSSIGQHVVRTKSKTSVKPRTRIVPFGLPCCATPIPSNK